MVRTTTRITFPQLLLWGIAAAAAASAAAGGGVCEYCKCTGDTIECHCCPDMMNVDLTERLMGPAEDMAKVKKLRVSDCNSASFRQSSLLALRALDALEVVNVSRVNFDDGAFEQMASLRLEKVDSLALAENAFFGTRLRELRLQSCKLRSLPSKALANVAGLETLLLHGVVLGNLGVAALALNMAADSSRLVFKDCLVNGAVAGSVSVQSVASLLVEGTTFRNLEPGAFNVTARDSAVVNGSDLSDAVPAQALCVAAPRVSVVGSKLKSPECLVRGAKEVLLERNQLEVDLVSLLEHVEGDSATFRYNRLWCDCAVEVARKLSALASDVLDANYCDVPNCPAPVPLSVFVKYVEESRPAHCSEQELCSRAPTTTSTTVAPLPRAGGAAPDTATPLLSLLALSLASFLRVKLMSM